MNPQNPQNHHESHLAETIRAHLDRVEHLMGAENSRPELHCPAWLRKTAGEQRLPVSAVILVTVAVQVILPTRFSFSPHLALPILEGVLLAGLVIANPRRICRESKVLRATSLFLCGVISLANTWSAVRLVHALVTGTAGDNATPLLVAGASIWGTNVVVFALWYWEFDRGGPIARANAHQKFPDFQFAQMQAPELAPPEWEPEFLDYLYLSFTNATAFSPTDTLPMSRWAKLTMMLQSAISLATIALVISRAVNILK